MMLWTAPCCSREQTLLILSHHKTGTVEAQKIYSWVCNKKHFLDENPPCPNVYLQMHGLNSSYDLRDTAVVHMLRHPIDSLLSGYLYHKSCAEPYWTDVNNRKYPYHLPVDFPIEGSYCKWLQSHPVSEGLTMELNRQLSSSDGIGVMIKNVVQLLELQQSIGTTEQVLSVCMTESATYTIPRVEQFIKSWSRTSGHLHVPDATEHHTSHEMQDALFEEAFRIISKRIPASILATFPCTSRIFDAQLSDAARQFVAGLSFDEYIPCGIPNRCF